MNQDIIKLQTRLWDGHRRIRAARTTGQSAAVIKDAEHRWCDLLGQLNQALCESGELEPTYHVDGQQFVTFGCEQLSREVRTWQRS